MRRIARAKANKMARSTSPAQSVQTLDQISEEERAEILKFVETEQTQVMYFFPPMQCKKCTCSVYFRVKL